MPAALRQHRTLFCPQLRCGRIEDSRRHALRVRCWAKRKERSLEGRLEPSDIAPRWRSPPGLAVRSTSNRRSRLTEPDMRSLLIRRCPFRDICRAVSLKGHFDISLWNNGGTPLRLCAVCLCEAVSLKGQVDKGACGLDKGALPPHVRRRCGATSNRRRRLPHVTRKGATTSPQRTAAVEKESSYSTAEWNMVGKPDRFLRSKRALTSRCSDRWSNFERTLSSILSIFEIVLPKKRES